MDEVAAFQQAFGGWLAGVGSISDDPALARALAVHRNTAAKAARDALAANYPVVEAVVGAEAFAACASTFVEQFPPREPRLCLYGGGFAAFVAAWQPFETLPYLDAVATVERMVIEALFAADAEPLDADALRLGIDPDMPLRLHPAARIARLASPAASLWHAHQPDAPADALDALEWRPEAVLVTRPALAVEVRTLDAAAASFLSAPTLGAAALAAHEAGGDVATIFAGLITAGALA